MLAMPPSDAHRVVDRGSCDCSCWDQRFKQGSRERSNGTWGYKSVYFSLDERLPFLVAWSAFCAAAAVAALRAIARGFTTPHSREDTGGWLARVQWGVIVLLQLYPSFYTFWAVWNYLNDGSSRMLWTQLFFGVSDAIVASTAVFAHGHGGGALHPIAMWASLAVSTLHVVSNLSVLGADAHPRFGIALMWWSDAATAALLAGALRALIAARPIVLTPRALFVAGEGTEVYDLRTARRDGAAACAFIVCATVYIRYACQWSAALC